MKDDIRRDARAQMDKAAEAFRRELSKLRTGRANVAILDGVKIDYYGTSTPLSQMANLSVPESRLITIQPWDASQLGAIEKAIMQTDLGLMPTNDGNVIRISIPALTEERRKDIVKLAKKYAEECKVSIRNSRRDANERLKELEKQKLLTQDELKKAQDDIQELTNKDIAKVEDTLSAKEKEILEI